MISRLGKRINLAWSDAARLASAEARAKLKGQLNDELVATGERRMHPDAQIMSEKATAETPAIKDKFCYANALNYARQRGLRVAAGFVVDKKQADAIADGKPKGLYTTKHAWVVDGKGRVVDPTLGRNKDMYVGRIVSHNDKTTPEDLKTEALRTLGHED
jgi:hypothetical protein